MKKNEDKAIFSREKNPKTSVTHFFLIYRRKKSFENQTMTTTLH